MGTKFAPSDGDLVHLFVRGLNKEAKEWLHREAPVDWYSTSEQVYAEAQRWELNNRMGRASADMNLTFLDKRRRVQNDRKGHKPFKRVHSNKFSCAHSAAPIAGLDRKEQAKKRQTREEDAILKVLKDAGICFKCRKGKHMASECPEK